MAKKSTERLVVSAIWSREDPLFPAHGQHGINPSFTIYKCGIMLILKGWCFDGFLVLLYYFIGVLYMALSLSSRTVLSYIRIRFASPNPRIALLLQRVLSREGCPRELVQLVIRSGRLNWGGYHRLKPHELQSSNLRLLRCCVQIIKTKYIASRNRSRFVFIGCRPCDVVCFVKNDSLSFYRRSQRKLRC